MKRDMRAKIALRDVMAKTLLFYPDLPKKSNKVYWALKDLGVRYHNRPDEKWDVGFLWHYQTKREKVVHPSGLFNMGGLDVSKYRLGKVHQKAFGYTYLLEDRGEVHPETRVLLKSNLQCKHRGRILPAKVAFSQCRSDEIVSLLLDNRVNEGEIEDIRVPVFKEEIPFVWTKRRPITQLMGSARSKDALAYYESPSKLFTNDELSLIRRFCKVFQTELAELDIIRHTDGRIYIIDVNNVAGTLGGSFPLVSPLVNKRRKQAINREWEKAFKRNFLT